MTRSTAALIIAVLFHLLILLFFWILGVTFIPESEPEKKEEERIRISLQERPDVKKEGVAKKPVPAKIAPPMPKGSQLKKLTKTQPLPAPEQQIKSVEPVPAKPQQEIPRPKKLISPTPSEPKVEPVPPQKPYIPFMKPAKQKPLKPEQKTAEANLTEVPKESRKLFSKLAQKQNIAPTQSTPAERKRYSQLYDDIKELYGDEFGKLTEGEQKYLLDNQEIMRRLTQTQLNQTGRTDIPNNLRVNEYNIVEFYLHPNGDMTDFRYLDHSGFHLLDDVTRDTIEAVYWRYPRPQQKTLIRYKFIYSLRGY